MTSSQGVMPFGGENNARGELGEAIVLVVAKVLLDLLATPDPGDGTLPPLTKFHGLRPPAIGVSEYLTRISKFSGCSDECFVLSLIYIDRLITKKKVRLDEFNVHRLLIASVMLAAKFFDDHYLDNSHYALVGGISKSEMNVLELEFLYLSEFSLYVSVADYDRYRTALFSKMGLPAVFLRNPYEVSSHSSSRTSAATSSSGGSYTNGRHF